MTGKGGLGFEAVWKQTERAVLTSCAGAASAERAAGTATDVGRTVTGYAVSVLG